MRQLEGKLLGTESAKPRGKAEPQKYDKARQAPAAALLTETKTYNPDADVTADAGKEEPPKVWLREQYDGLSRIMMFSRE